MGAGPEQRTGQRCVSESEFCAPTGGRAGGWARRRARVSTAAPTHHNDAGVDQEQRHHVYQQLDLILFVVVVRGLHYSELIITLSLLACSRSFRDHDSVTRRRPLDRRRRSCLARVGCGTERWREPPAALPDAGGSSLVCALHKQRSIAFLVWGRVWCDKYSSIFLAGLSALLIVG